MWNDLVGGYYDAGDAIKLHFPQSFAMTILSWSVLEYSAKYEAAGELNHVKDVIKWGTDYLLKTFDSTADTIERMAIQVGVGDTSRGSTNPNDQYCWMRPEDMDYPRPVLETYQCSDLAGEMAAALAAASSVFKDNEAYSRKLVHGATTLYTFSTHKRGKYTKENPDAAIRYNSSGYYDEILWGGAWLYYAKGNLSYLSVALDRKIVAKVWTPRFWRTQLGQQTCWRYASCILHTWCIFYGRSFLSMSIIDAEHIVFSSGIT